MKLNEKQKSMIEVLQLAHDNLSKYGLCDTLNVLCENEKIADRERVDAQNFMQKYFSSDSAYYNNRVWFLSEYVDDCYIPTDNSKSYEKQGFTQRKNLLLDAISFIKVTGVTK